MTAPHWSSFREQRNSDWTKNAPFWSDYVDANEPRRLALSWFLDRIVLPEHGLAVDLGCGEGKLLRMVRGLRPDLALYGIDFCEAMLREARARTRSNIQFLFDDLEAGERRVSLSAQVVIATFVMDEVEDLARAFAYAYCTTSRGGRFCLLTLDHDQEAARHRLTARNHPSNLHTRHFNSGSRHSPRPYYSFLRPNTCYLEGAKAAGFRTLHTEPYAAAFEFLPPNEVVQHCYYEFTRE